jgi:hypothetical protein
MVAASLVATLVTWSTARRRIRRTGQRVAEGRPVEGYGVDGGGTESCWAVLGDGVGWLVPRPGSRYLSRL